MSNHKYYKFEELQKEGDFFEVEKRKDQKMRSFYAYVRRVGKEKGYRVMTKQMQSGRILRVTRGVDVH